MAEDGKTAELLKEQSDRSGKFMVLAARRADTKMVPLLFRDDLGAATAAANALTDTGWHKAEVWTKHEAEAPTTK